MPHCFSASNTPLLSVPSACPRVRLSRVAYMAAVLVAPRLFVSVQRGGGSYDEVVDEESAQMGMGVPFIPEPARPPATSNVRDVVIDVISHRNVM